jgi:hypothetical protein
MSLPLVAEVQELKKVSQTAVAVQQLEGAESEACLAEYRIHKPKSINAVAEQPQRRPCRKRAQAGQGNAA